MEFRKINTIKTIIEEHYCEKSDITFLTEEEIYNFPLENNLREHHSINVVGFYFGKPNKESTQNFKYDNECKCWIDSKEE